MISYIKGTLEQIGENSIVIDNSGIGYEISVSTHTMGKLPRTGEIVKIFTFLQSKEDGLTLFGFLTKEEISLFHRLISVTGIGPKMALTILASMTPSQIMIAIITDDIAALSKAQGVGKKTAQRLVLELRDKIKTDDAVKDALPGAQQTLPQSAGEKQDAIDALTALGYGRSEAVRAVMEVALEGMKTEAIIKLALKKLNVL